MNCPACIRVKEISNCTCDTVYLCKSTYTHKTYTNTEKRKNLCKPLPLFTHTVFYVIERSAKNVTFFIYSTILNSQETLGILCSHSEKCRYNHPEQRTRTTSRKSSCNTDNITCSDSRRKCRTQSTETCNFAFSAFFVFYHKLQSLTKVSYLQSSYSDCKINTCKNYQYNKRNSPYKSFDLFQNLAERLKTFTCHFPYQSFLFTKIQ